MAIVLPQSLRGVTLWRYMSLQKLLALLQSRSLHFSQLKLLRDPCEGSVPIAWESAVDVSQPDPISGSSRRTEWQEYQFFPGPGEYLKDKRLGDELYVSCWHAHEQQSAAMWSVYSSENGIAVKTTCDLLANAFQSCERNIELAAVQYMESVPGLICGRPWTIKRLPFQDEREVRACVRDPDCKQPGLLVPVDVETLVEEVWVSPESEAWTEAVVKDVVAKYDLRKPVQRSDLYTPR
jgi:hypothetical protein